MYGASKLAGEQAVLASGARAIVVRTSWVYAHTGKQFRAHHAGGGAQDAVLAGGGGPERLPDDGDGPGGRDSGDRGSVTGEGWQDRFGGVVHAAGTGWTTWHGLAVAAFEEAARYGAPVPEVAAIRTADWPTPAWRPADSRLDCGRLRAVFGVALPGWRDGLRRTIDALAVAGGIGG